MAAVCRCFPGKNAKGGDRVPDQTEITNCSRWMQSEIALLKPTLVVPVGKLAIAQFIPVNSLADVIGKTFAIEKFGEKFDLIPLPHPSGASPWHRMEPGLSLLRQALRRIRKHSAFQVIIE